MSRSIHRCFPDGNGGEANILVVDSFFGAAAFELVASQMRQQLLGIPELGHGYGVAQVGDLDVAASGKDQFFKIKYFCSRGNEFFFVLETISNRNVADGDFSWHSGKNFPVIILGHGGLFS